MMEKNYTKAKKVCSELIDVILSSPAVQRKQRLGIAYDYFSRCELLLRDFDKAVEHTKKAQENFIPSSFNYSLSQEQEYYALFFNKKYAEAERVLMMILGGTSRKEMGELRYAKYNWLHANVLFRQKKFKEALNILKQKWETAKEKESREVEMRLLTLMAHLELGQKEEAKLITESLRKFVQRNKAKTTPRHELILKLLLQAARKDFVFDEKAKPLVVQLASDSKYKWEFLSPELIPFHEWLSERIK
jgi:tetratricopeptide (TPR) repeat protein